MPASNLVLRERLIAMHETDERVRSRLAAGGVLNQGYHPEMQAVHEANAAELNTLLQGRWPSAAEAGADGQNAAFVIVQHAIGQPDFQRRYLNAIKIAIAQGAAPGWHGAMLEDRIRFFEGRPQVYGTQLDWDDAGQLSPLPIEDPSNVEARRAAVGLEPLAAVLETQRASARRDGAPKPADRAARQAAFEDWARKIGWRV